MNKIQNKGLKEKMNETDWMEEEKKKKWVRRI